MPGLDELTIPVQNSQIYLLYAGSGHEEAAENFASLQRAKGARVMQRNPKYYTTNESLELTTGEGQVKVPIRGVFILRGSANQWQIQQDYEKEGRSVLVFDPPAGPASRWIWRR